MARKLDVASNVSDDLVQQFIGYNDSFNELFAAHKFEELVRTQYCEDGQFLAPGADAFKGRKNIQEFFEVTRMAR